MPFDGFDKLTAWQAQDRGFATREDFLGIFINMGRGENGGMGRKYRKAEKWPGFRLKLVAKRVKPGCAVRGLVMCSWRLGRFAFDTAGMDLSQKRRKANVEMEEIEYSVEVTGYN